MLVLYRIAAAVCRSAILEWKKTSRWEKRRWIEKERKLENKTILLCCCVRKKREEEKRRSRILEKIGEKRLTWPLLWEGIFFGWWLVSERVWKRLLFAFWCSKHFFKMLIFLQGDGALCPGAWHSASLNGSFASARQGEGMVPSPLPFHGI